VLDAGPLLRLLVQGLQTMVLPSVLSWKAWLCVALMASCSPDNVCYFGSMPGDMCQAGPCDHEKSRLCYEGTSTVATHPGQ
jgi:hypothetical protein